MAFSGAGGLGRTLTPGANASFGAVSGHDAGMVVLHGSIGGLSSDLQGGSFASRFYAAGVTRAFGPALEPGGRVGISTSQGRVFAAAIIGGTASELSGGKFANGAVTAAFSRAFNDEGAENLGPQGAQREAPSRMQEFYDSSVESLKENLIPFGV